MFIRLYDYFFWCCQVVKYERYIIVIVFFEKNTAIAREYGHPGCMLDTIQDFFFVQVEHESTYAAIGNHNVFT